jgi:isopropylmalate/homocitrate/citramalate synthase
MRTRIAALKDAEGCTLAGYAERLRLRIRSDYARLVRVLLCDVGPRDGLQNEQEVLPPETRAELVERLAAAGLRRIEAVSFVRADRVPQMAGAEEVIERVRRRDGVELSGLVLNERGWERFAAAGLDRVNVTFAATESFNLRNGNATLAEAVERAETILASAGETRATVTISCAFGCPFEGRVDPGAVAELAAPFAGRAEVVLADTIGVATPSAVRALVERARAKGFHGHNTRNTGYANCLAALEAGAHVLDASVGGLGGCPFSPRATGNVATEDLVYLLEGEGVETGIDLDALLGVSCWLEGVLGRRLEGYLYRAGPWPPA